MSVLPQTQGKIYNKLIFQILAEFNGKSWAITYVFSPARNAASTRVKVGAKWKDFGKLLVHV